MTITDTASTPPVGPPSVKQRIVTFDLLRGYFILVIASIHLHYYPSLFGSFTGRGQLWVSEAEGFFFVSGLIVTMVRRRTLERHGWRVATRQLLQRAWTLYAAATVLTLLYLLIAGGTNALHVAGAKDGLSTQAWPGLLVSIITLQYSYGWNDFLDYYALFLALLPAVLALLYRGWAVAVGLASVAVWGLRWAGDYGVWNPFMQWQLFFFMGCVIGYYWPALEAKVRQLSVPVRRRLYRTAMVLAGVVLALSATLVFVSEPYATGGTPGGLAGWIVRANLNPAYQSLLVNGRIGLLRPVVFLVVFAGAFALVRRYESTILHWAGWLLLPFGSNSLYVYIVEGALLFVIPYILRPSGFLINTGLELLVIALAWLAVHRRFMFRWIPR